MRGFVAAIATLVASACAGNGAMTPLQAAHAAGGSAVAEGVVDGRRASANQPHFTVPVRYNPADCECPEWEVYAYGKWMRVYVQGRPEAVAALEGLRSSDPLSLGTVNGRFDDRPLFSRRNVRYPVFLVR